MKKTILLTAILISAAFCRAQEGPADPYKKDAAKKEVSKGDGADPITRIAIGLEIFDCPKLETEKLLRETVDGDALHKQINSWIEKGEAGTVDSTVIVGKSGNRLKIESVSEVVSPSKRIEVPSAPKTPLFPGEFQTTNAGLSFEADPVLNANGTLALNFAFDRSQPQPRTDHPDLVDSGAIQKGDIVEIDFLKQHTVRNIPGIEPGKRTLIGTFDPFDPDQKASRTVVALVRWDRLDAWPLKDPSKMNTDLPIRVRFEWVEVPADQWHQVSNQNEVSELAGKSWETVQKWITEGKATSSKTLSLSAQNGTRVKAQTVKLIRYAPEYTPPSVEGGACAPKAFESREIGVTAEIDAEYSPAGQVNLNIAPEISSQHGESVFYRAGRGTEWVPGVTMPNFYKMTVRTQVVLEENAHLLTGVFTPDGEDGSPDLSRKILLYIHNDTYRN